jgi:hypothetical protein
VAFRDRLLATIRAARPVLEDPGVLVVGSEVPNLLEPGAAATLVVSQDLDISLLGPRAGMPDPRPRRKDVAEVLRRLAERDRGVE